MQDRFENEVQKKLEELKLTPSAPVWEKIEMEITVEKKRRRGIGWLLLAALLLCGGAWWAYSDIGGTDKKSLQHTIEQSPASENKKDAGTAIEESTLHQKANTTAAATHQDEKILHGRATKSEQADFSSKTRQSHISQQSEQPLGTDNPVTGRADQKRDVGVTEIAVGQKEKYQDEIKQVDAKMSAQNPATVLVPLDESITGQPAQIVNDSINTPVMNKEPVHETTGTDSLLKKKIASNKKWHKQINFSAGWTDYTSGVLTKSATADAFASVGTAVPSPVGNTNMPSSTSGGFGMSIGFSMVKQLSEKWEIAAGLQYGYFSSQINVGEKKHVDTIVRSNAATSQVNGFYTNTGTSTYTNHFHVLELPVTVSFRPLKAPLYVSLGVSYGRLIETNALTFSRTANIYYENDENYNKNMIPMQASIQYRFRDKKGINFQVGPMIQYTLSQLQKESNDGKTHLLFAGLKTSVNF